MADTTYFQPESTLGRPVRDLLDNEIKERLALLEAVLNADRVIADAVETKLGQFSDAGNPLSTQSQALTDNTAFDLFTFPLADEQGACWEVRATIYADDGTDHQMISLLFHVNAINQGGTVTAVVTEGIADVVAASGGTLTLAGAAAEGDANIVDVSITANSSLTPTTLTVDWEARCIGSSAAASRVGTKVNANA